MSKGLVTAGVGDTAGVDVGVGVLDGVKDTSGVGVGVGVGVADGVNNNAEVGEGVGVESCAKVGAPVSISI
jgi:hypothetical protein